MPRPEVSWRDKSIRRKRRSDSCGARQASGMKIRLERAGAHFFDRKSGLNVLLDEVHPGPECWSSAPRYMSIALANACDLRCSFCYASKLPHRIPAELVRGWAGELDANGCFGIGFGGGEPTLYAGFPRLCRDIYDHTNLAVTMTTHGHHFTTALVDDLTGSVSFIRLSMDGIGDTYERIRGRSFKDFNDCLALVRATATFGINCVVNGDTIDELDRVAEHAFASGAAELLLLPETGDDGEIRLTKPQVETLERWVAYNHHHNRIAMSQHGAEAIAAPTLFSSSDDTTYNFLHVDASMMLKVTAFARDGVALSPEKPLMDAVAELRSISSVPGAIA